MIGPLWDTIVQKMAGLGFLLDSSEADSLVDRHFVVRLPGASRDTVASTTGKARVERDIRLRLQFRERRDASLHRIVAEEVERVVVAMRGTPLLFESYSVGERPGGLIVEMVFSARDSMN